MNELNISTEYITLGQLLKMTNLISSGGMAKWFLEENVVFVNDEKEQRRGKKLRHEDVITIPEVGSFKINDTSYGSSDAH